MSSGTKSSSSCLICPTHTLYHHFTRAEQSGFWKMMMLQSRVGATPLRTARANPKAVPTPAIGLPRRISPSLLGLHVSSAAPTIERSKLTCQAARGEEVRTGELVGEDAASFDVEKQSVKSWSLFFVLLTTVLGALYVVRAWMYHWN